MKSGNEFAKKITKLLSCTANILICVYFKTSLDNGFIVLMTWDWLADAFFLSNDTFLNSLSYTRMWRVSILCTESWTTICNEHESTWPWPLTSTAICNNSTNWFVCFCVLLLTNRLDVSQRWWLLLINCLNVSPWWWLLLTNCLDVSRWFDCCLVYECIILLFPHFL